jgi:hypothetical protein
MPKIEPERALFASRVAAHLDLKPPCHSAQFSMTGRMRSGMSEPTVVEYSQCGSVLITVADASSPQVRVRARTLGMLSGVGPTILSSVIKHCPNHLSFVPNRTPCCQTSVLLVLEPAQHASGVRRLSSSAWNSAQHPASAHGCVQLGGCRAVRLRVFEASRKPIGHTFCAFGMTGHFDPV